MRSGLGLTFQLTEFDAEREAEPRCELFARFYLFPRVSSTPLFTGT